MQVILFASYLAYGIIFVFGSLRYRFFVYVGLFLLCFTVPIYTPFLGGIVAADIVVHYPVVKPSRWSGGLFAMTGLVVGNFPEVLLPSELTVYSAYGVGALFLLLGCARSSTLQKVLSHPWLIRAGELSFSLILVHATIMLSFSAWFFLKMQTLGLAYGPTLFLTLLTAIPVIYFFTVLFQRYVEKPTARFTQWGYHLVRSRLGLTV